MPSLPIKLHQNPLRSLGAAKTGKILKLDYLPLESSDFTFLNAHLNMMPSLPMKLNQNPLRG